jgi:hypothetical protein
VGCDNLRWCESSNTRFGYAVNKGDADHFVTFHRPHSRTHKRGVAELQAILAARTGKAAFAQATISWFDDPGLGLGERLDLALSELKALVT